MVAANTAKKILHAVADALPDTGPSLLDRLELIEGWGETLVVRLHATVVRQADSSHEAYRLRDAVAGSVVRRRSRVEIVWGGST